MLRNYLKIALRTLWKQKGITAINVLGLAAGMAVCLLVGLLVWDQITHDDFHPGADRLYRVTMEVKKGADRATTPEGLALALQERAAGVEAATQLKQTPQRLNLMVKNQGVEARGYYAEPSFFDLFGFKLLSGNEEKSLSAPQTAVVSREVARRLYGETNPIGKTFRLDGEETFTVTGVIDQTAYRSHLNFDILFSFATTQVGDDHDWGSYYTYLRLTTGYAPSDLAASLEDMEGKYLSSESPGESTSTGFRLQAVSAISLSFPLLNEDVRGKLTPTMASILASLAFIVLLAAGFNYINLSTARSLARAREVGVRKTVGAHRRHVMVQFVAESVLMAFLALGLAVVFLQWLVPAFNRLSVINEMRLQIGIEPGPLLYGMFLGFALVVGMAAGLYPAWHLSRFDPSRVLKASAGSKTPDLEWMTLRKVLIVLQFAVAFIVVVTATLFNLQAEYMGEAEKIRLRTDNLIHIELQDAPYEPFQQEARQIPQIERIGGASHVPLIWQTAGTMVESKYTAESITSHLYAVDFEAVQSLDLPFIAMGDWSEKRFESGQVVVINESAVHELGFETPKGALGQPLSLNRFDSSWTVRVEGVVQDIYVSFTEEPTRPIVFHYNPDRFEVALAHIVPGEDTEAVTSLTETWRQFDTTSPASVDRFEELLRQGYTAPILEGSQVLALVAGLAILISCLGLLGIATFAVQTRTREIGIRKALGATMPSIVGLLSKDFLWMTGISIALGVPLAWWVNQLWLQNFAYRIDLSVWPFALSAAGLLVLALLAIGSQTIGAARMNPADAIRQE